MEAGPSFSALFVETTFFAPFEGITTLAKSSPAFAFFLPATLAGCTFRVFGNLHIDKAAVHLEFVEGLKYKIGKLGIRIEKGRSEEHTSELQSREKLVCRLLLEKKKKE